ncbi:MAG: ABC transporter permease [Phycisphaerae bacterium]
MPSPSRHPSELPLPALPLRRGRQGFFLACLIVLGGTYVLLILAMLVADMAFTTPGEILRALDDRDTLYAIKLSLISCTITSVLALWVAVPIGYLMARYQFRGKAFLDTILDIPIVLPPLVVGVSLLILFRFRPFVWVDRYVTYEIPGLILAQFMVAAAFAVRTMRVTFEQINPRTEQVALTLGCTRQQAFWMVLIPQCRQGMMTAITLAWARSLGEFGPVLVFAGANPMRTEVLPTTVFLRMQAGDLTGMLAVSLIMIITSMVVLVLARIFGLRTNGVI